ncbi:MAG: dihydroneopterin aldolase [Chthoniobacteraceae bacterium]|nr:dihydroneopterin aldolase [Chthoniobacteraceae bacterium]
MDLIHIEALELSARIGVPEEERAVPQRLTINLTLQPSADFRALSDTIEKTVNYFEVARAVQAIARERPRCLLETLGEDISAALLKGFALQAVEIELRKYILPDTAHVAVRLRREK